MFLFASFTAEAEKKDGERDGDETEVDGGGVSLGEQGDWACGFFFFFTKSLKNRGDPVAEVRAKQGHRNHIENHDERITETNYDHFPSVVALRSIWHNLHQ